MGPLGHSGGHDVPWMAKEIVLGEAAVVDDVVGGFEEAVREPVIAHEFPHIFGRVELSASRWQRK